MYKNIMKTFKSLVLKTLRLCRKDFKNILMMCGVILRNVKKIQCCEAKVILVKYFSFIFFTIWKKFILIIKLNLCVIYFNKLCVGFVLQSYFFILCFKLDEVKTIYLGWFIIGILGCILTSAIVFYNFYVYINVYDILMWC